MQEERKRYLEVSHQYFRGEISIDQLYEQLKEFISIQTDIVNLPADERVMLIANHPAAEDALSLPAKDISGLKGGNYRNFPSFWFPVVRQLLLKEAMRERNFLTLAYDIGWRESLQEMGHLLINHSGSGRCQKIISCMQKEKDCSLVVFPEGGVRNLEIFHTGFFYIACALEIRYLVVGSFSPLLSLEGKNEFRIIHTEDMNPLIHPVRTFVDEQKQRIKKVTKA